MVRTLLDFFSRIIYIWIKQIDPEVSPWTRVSLKSTEYVDDLKKAIKNKRAPELDAYAAVQLILKAKNKYENEEHAVELEDPRETIASVQRRFGVDFEILVLVPINERTLFYKPKRLEALSIKKLQRHKGGSKNNLRQYLLINSVIKKCGRRRHRFVIDETRASDILWRIKTRSKRSQSTLKNIRTLEDLANI